MHSTHKYCRWLHDLAKEDVALVGGKNASLGEMIRELNRKSVQIPDGFATTSDAYRSFIAHNELQEEIEKLLDAYNRDKKKLDTVGRRIRKLFLEGEMPPDLAGVIEDFYSQLSDQYDSDGVDVAVRSSATAEDLPEASFAGQQETFLNISGAGSLVDAVQRCYASLFTDRAISYRQNKGFDHMTVALSVGVQKMIRADKACAGVIFTIDTETGFNKTITITGAWGLGENIVQGTVTPDEFVVYKPFLKRRGINPVLSRQKGSKLQKMIYSTKKAETTRNVAASKKEQESFVLNDEEVMKLASWAAIIENHYDKPMDIEWAKDGDSNELYIVQARPETVQSQKTGSLLKQYSLKESGEQLVSGFAIGQGIAAAEATVIKNASDIRKFKEGTVLVTGMTDPDWVPIMKKAAGIVTDHGGRTSHAAIVSRELGIPAVVGTDTGTEDIKNGSDITLSCAEGEVGKVFKGLLEYEESELDIHDLQATDVAIMINIASPSAAFRWWQLPCDGVGLARMEFIINNMIMIHPMALQEYKNIKDRKIRRAIDRLTRGYREKTEYFIDKLADGVSRIAAAHYPKPVIVRMSDFKSNEYANLIGGRLFEEDEDNPMIGMRGASRYYSKRYRRGFDLECRAMKTVREERGFDNVILMIPFCRTLEEADKALQVLAENGLVRGVGGLKIYVMCEIPANVVLADGFATRFDGFSIGSNDLTQLVLGIDRDAEELADLFDERNEAVKRMIRSLIKSAHAAGKKVGICGQAPSDYPEFAEFLVRSGIDSISLNPDSVANVIRHVNEVERKMHKK
ncbi:MAG: phosphoenolpyruvate synthase [Desulfobulbaceae bacterium]|nr:phosphoenolpyruvate synthase [Desulfobulbaceae bacterium]